LSVRVIEPNPYWSTVELRDYKNDWPWGPVIDYSSVAQAHNHKQRPNTESAVPLSVIFHFNQWTLPDLVVATAQFLAASCFTK